MAGKARYPFAVHVRPRVGLKCAQITLTWFRVAALAVRTQPEPHLVDAGQRLPRERHGRARGAASCRRRERVNGAGRGRITWRGAWNSGWTGGRSWRWAHARAFRRALAWHRHTWTLNAFPCGNGTASAGAGRRWGHFRVDAARVIEQASSCCGCWLACTRAAIKDERRLRQVIGSNYLETQACLLARSHRDTCFLAYDSSAPSSRTYVHISARTRLVIDRGRTLYIAHARPGGADGARSGAI